VGVSDIPIDEAVGVTESTLVFGWWSLWWCGWSLLEYWVTMACAIIDRMRERGRLSLLTDYSEKLWC